MWEETAEMATRAPTEAQRRQTYSSKRYATRLVAAVLILTSVVTFIYTGLSVYVATQLVYETPKPITETPAKYQLQYRDVSFPAREDEVKLQGWFVPGRLSGGRLTSARTIIMVHGTRQNRATPNDGLIELTNIFVKAGFAVLGFDMRGMGESQPAPLTVGYFEQRDVLGAVDFLQSGPIPYPELGRPTIIGGWGISMGAATLLLATAREPAIKAVVSDCAYSDIIPILQREIHVQGGLPEAFTPGALLALRVLYGADYYAVRPVDVVASIAPRPIFFIHGDADQYVPFADMQALADAAQTGFQAQVQTWAVPGVGHARSFKTTINGPFNPEYGPRVVAFFTKSLGSDPAGA
jgi:fermentation-respiration switch protein FrsA (DUF1100 family)